jgi:hypothetical protein
MVKNWDRLKNIFAKKLEGKIAMANGIFKVTAI